MFGLKAPGAAGRAVCAPRQPPAAAATQSAPPQAVPRRQRRWVAARDAAAPAPLPASGLDDEALDQALRAQLNTRWLPYDGHTARKALTLAAGVAVAVRRCSSGASSAAPAAAVGAPPPPPQPPTRESVARSALPVYQALLADRLLDTWRFKPLPVAPAGAGGAPQQQQQQQAAANVYMSRVLWHERWRLANTVRILSQERAECERTLAKGGISKWRADSLASQAECLSADILAIERLLRISEGWGDALPTTVPTVTVGQEQQQE